MRAEEMITNKKSNDISLLELRKLLVALKEHRNDICVRFRVLGQMWYPNFSRVITLTEERVMVNDERLNRLISLDLRNIMQFEIEDRFQDFNGHQHYDVAPTGW